MKNRLVLKKLWFTTLFDCSPRYLYFDSRFDCFEIGCLSQARKFKYEFTDEEVEQLKKDYNLLYFRIERR